jgi:hypothetical protein
VLEEQRRDRRLEERGDDVAALDDPLELVRRDASGSGREPLAEVQVSRDRGAALPRDDV